MATKKSIKLVTKKAVVKKAVVKKAVPKNTSSKKDSVQNVLDEKQLKKLAKSTVEFKSVKIGEQEWMVENLNVDKFRNGDQIQEVKTEKEWKEAGNKKQPAWCYYENKLTNGKKYGKLYNWFAVNDSRGLAPEGWHIPSDEDWCELSEFYEDMTDIYGDEVEIGRELKSESGWSEYGNGNNDSGFSGLPGGGRGDNGTFYSVELNGNWWSSTQKDNNRVLIRFLRYSVYKIYELEASKNEGLSVRCLKD